MITEAVLSNVIKLHAVSTVSPICMYVLQNFKRFHWIQLQALAWFLASSRPIGEFVLYKCTVYSGLLHFQ